MLRGLQIENAAVIERADIEFGRGLTVLTGETGAGKSIVIDAINALLGERITRETVRHGAENAFLSGVFDELSPEAEAFLAEQGYRLEEDGALLIQRSVSADGRGSCRINGRPATVSVLRQLGRMLVNIHGQHENQVLLQPERHIDYLDRLGRLLPVRQAYEKEYHNYCRIRRAMKALSMDEEQKAALSETLTRQIGEIDAAALKPGEEEELLARRELARHAEKIADELWTVRQALSGEEDQPGALALLTGAVGSLAAAGQVSEELAALAARLQSALYDVQACAEEAREAEDSLAFDEKELAALEDRLALIRRLVRQYGTDEQSVLARRDELQKQLDAIEGNAAQLADLQRQSDEARDATIAAAAKLSEARKAAAVLFEKNVCQQLAFLDMPHVKLVVEMEPTALTAIGGDRVEFLLSANPGEPPKSIAKTASGGELSRIMLALKSVLAGVDEIGTLVFDEVDSGISGRAAAKVGTLMRQIAEKRQVLCVTHLAQIAVCGHDHLLVQKRVEKGRTFTAVERLDEGRRLQETARIIDGEATATALEAARDMRRRATEQ